MKKQLFSNGSCSLIAAFSRHFGNLMSLVSQEGSTQKDFKERAEEEKINKHLGSTCEQAVVQISLHLF